MLLSKRNRLVVIIILILANMMIPWNGQAVVRAATFSGGNGTEDDPYIIMTAAQLDEVRNHLSASFLLGADIDLSSYASGEGWSPIAKELEIEFTGTFDGGGHVISNLTINSSDKKLGLFGGSKGTIKNIGLHDVDISGSGTSVGALVGRNMGLITNAYATGNVSSSADHASIGGLVGRHNANIVIKPDGVDITKVFMSDVYAKVNVSASGDAANVGGLVGENSWSEISHAYATGNVISTGRSTIHSKLKVGGLVGNNNGATISNAYATGNVSNTLDSAYVGGLVGFVTSSYIEQSFIETVVATGNVTVGGNSHAGESHAGGLIGQIFDAGMLGAFDSIGTRITNAIATGNVTGSKGSRIGGLIGSSYGEGDFLGMMPAVFIKYVYSVGNVSGSATNAGLVADAHQTEIAYGYSTHVRAVQRFSAGELKYSGVRSIPEMKQRSTYFNYNFSSTWGIREGETFAYLKAFAPELQVHDLEQSLFNLSPGHDQLIVNSTLSDASIGEQITVTYDIKDSENDLVLSVTDQVHSDTIQFDTAQSIDLSTLEDGTYTLEVSAADTNHPPISAAPLTFTVDTAAPTMTFGINGNAVAQTSVSTMVFADDTSGIDPASLRFIWTESTDAPGSEATWSNFANGDTLTKSGVSGEWYLHVQAADRAGNTVITTSNLFRLDNDTPVVTVELEKDDGSEYSSGSWTNQSVTASVYAFDDLSGVDRVEYSLDGGATWHAYHTPVSFTVEGTYALIARAFDTLGNTSSSLTNMVNISRSGLILDVTLKQADNTNYSSSTWTNQSVTASVYTVQSTPGMDVTSTAYSLDGGTTWELYVSPLVFESAGTYEIDVITTDNAGNELRLSPASRIQIDKAEPVVSFSTNGRETYASAASTSVIVSDEASGVDTTALHYVWTQAASAPDSETLWMNFTSGDPLEISGVYGDWYLHIQAADAAGNKVETVSNRFRLYIPSTGSDAEEDTGTSLNDPSPVDHIVIEKVNRQDGSVMEQVNLDADTLRHALNASNQDSPQHITTIHINDSERIVQVSLPASVIISALMTEPDAEPDAIIELQLGGSSYQLNVHALNMEQIANDLGVGLEDLNVNVIIEQVDSDSKAEIERIAEIEGLQLVSGVLNFQVTAEANGQIMGIADFGGTYMAKAIVLDTNPTATEVNQLIGVHYDPQTHTFHFVPSQIRERADGTWEMVMKVPHNSFYAVVKVQHKTFSDLTGHWAKEAVELLASRLIVNGVSDHLYAPDHHITRAEFTALLVRSLGLSTLQKQADSRFADVDENAWYAQAVKIAAEVGLVQGIDEDHFAPNETITREQLAVMVSNAMKFLGTPTLAHKADDVLGKYTDHDQIAEWAKQSVARVSATEIIQGYPDRSFAPQQNVTRAEAAVILKRFLQAVEFMD